MNKPRVVLYQSPYQTESLFHSLWFRDLVSEYFWIDYYDSNVSYLDKAVFVMGCNHYLAQEIREPFLDRRVIVDALWESNTGKWQGCSAVAPDNHLLFYGNQLNSYQDNLKFVPNWFWYNESLWYAHRGYNNYQPQRTYQRKMLIPSGKDRGWRLEALDYLKPWLEQSYWSNVSHGIFLPGTTSAKRMDHRWFNADWYDHTYFSIVLESIRSWEERTCFLTEKTYKPIAFCHPFMLVGATGCLALLRQQGFETFDNLFDESYDLQDDFDAKMKIIVENISRFEWQPHDVWTEARLAYNRDRFYDHDLVRSLIVQDIIEPMMEYIETS